jgi:ribosomal protein L37E
MECVLELPRWTIFTCWRCSLRTIRRGQVQRKCEQFCMLSMFSREISCTNCIPGQYSAAPSSAHCSSCPAGTFSSNAKPSCQLCENGRFSPSSFAECFQCSNLPGLSIEFFNVDHISCSRCVKEKYHSLDQKCKVCGDGMSCELNRESSLDEAHKLKNGYWRISATRVWCTNARKNMRLKVIQSWSTYFLHRIS